MQTVHKVYFKDLMLYVTKLVKQCTVSLALIIRSKIHHRLARVLWEAVAVAHRAEPSPAAEIERPSPALLPHRRCPARGAPTRCGSQGAHPQDEEEPSLWKRAHGWHHGAGGRNVCK